MARYGGGRRGFLGRGGVDDSKSLGYAGRSQGEGMLDGCGVGERGRNYQAVVRDSETESLDPGMIDGNARKNLGSAFFEKGKIIFYKACRTRVVSRLLVSQYTFLSET